MSRLLLLAGVCILAVACKQPGDDQASPDDAVVAEAMIETNETLCCGAAAYKRACATCHEQGLDNAPKTGDRDAWAGRSWLWEAILVEHARQGYLGMPAQGDDTQLNDAEISLAAEYMLRQVHPEVPPD